MDKINIYINSKNRSEMKTQINLLLKSLMIY